MFPFMLPFILAFAAGAAIVALLIIYWDDIVSWFQARTHLVERDRENLAFTLKDRLDSGAYRVVQGVFNKRQSTVVDGRVMNADALDSKLERAHANEQLVIYPY